MQDPNYLEELFKSTEIWGYGGPLIIIVIGYLVAKKDKRLGAMYLIFVMMGAIYYFDLASTTDPVFFWHAFITLFGGLFVCVYPIFDR